MSSQRQDLPPTHLITGVLHLVATTSPPSMQGVVRLTKLVAHSRTS